MTDKLNAERLRALDEAATAGPWAYRPDAMDDWGIVKSPRQPVEGFEDGLRCCLAQFRHPEALDEDVLNAHRRAKTDPWQGNAELVTYLRNAVPAILAMAEERDRMRVALADIVNPLAAAQRDAEAQGARLSGEAYAICNSLNFVQNLARRALGKDQAS